MRLRERRFDRLRQVVRAVIDGMTMAIAGPACIKLMDTPNGSRAIRTLFPLLRKGRLVDLNGVKTSGTISSRAAASFFVPAHVVS